MHICIYVCIYLFIYTQARLPRQDSEFLKCPVTQRCLMMIMHARRMLLFSPRTKPAIGFKLCDVVALRQENSFAAAAMPL